MAETDDLHVRQLGCRAAASESRAHRKPLPFVDVAAMRAKQLRRGALRGLSEDDEVRRAPREPHKAERMRWRKSGAAWCSTTFPAHASLPGTCAGPGRNAR